MCSPPTLQATHSGRCTAQANGHNTKQPAARIAFWSIANEHSRSRLHDTHQALVAIEQTIAAAKDKHNGFLKELGLKPLP
jgi:hypothetical protein